MKKIFLVVIPLLTILLIYTHQILWSPIHGDGAVYSHLMKEFSETGQLHWRTTVTDGAGENGIFTDHPYLFFIYSYPFVKIFGSSDWAIKIPNILVALFIVYLLFLMAGRGPFGLLTGFILAINPTFELQTRQPMLDPLAQALAMSSLALIYLRRNFFYAGLILGLAFLTKGLELLPNLAGIFLFSLLVIHEDRKTKNVSYLRAATKFFLGLSLPIIAWFLWDFLWNHGLWCQGYYERQFAHRFFTSSNQAKPFSLGFVFELFNVFEPQLFLFIIGSLWLWKTKKSFSLLWKYNVIYIFFTCLAFTLIKKVALQHYTGIFLSTSLALGMMAKEFYETRSLQWQLIFKRMTNALSLISFVGMIGASIYFWTTPFNKQDLWGNILAARTQLNQSPQTPVLIDTGVFDYYGLLYTAQWYWPNPVYSTNERELVKKLLTTQGKKEIFLVRGLDPQRFSIEKQILE